MWWHTCNPNTCDVEAGGSGVQGQPQLHHEFKANLSCTSQNVRQQKAGSTLLSVACEAGTFQRGHKQGPAPALPWSTSPWKWSTLSRISDPREARSHRQNPKAPGAKGFVLLFMCVHDCPRGARGAHRSQRCTPSVFDCCPPKHGRGCGVRMVCMFTCACMQLRVRVRAHVLGGRRYISDVCVSLVVSP